MQPGDEFEWDKDNEGKLAARHGVDRYEAEQAAVDLGASIKRIGTDRVGSGVLAVLETQSSRRKGRTEGEADESRTEANRQS